MDELGISNKLAMIVTRYDRKQSTKRHYNVYALGIYLARADEVASAILNDGTPWRDAVSAGFTDRLRDYIIRELEAS